MRRRLAPVLGVAGLCLALASGCATSQPSGGSVAGTVVDLSFDHAPTHDAPVALNKGDKHLRVSLVTVNGGQLRSVPGQEKGRAVSFPAFDPSRDGKRAVLKVLSPAGGDDLSPGSSDFEFGASFRLDAPSYGDTRASDNGDNLLQMGRFSDASQYKLDFEDRAPTCRVKGSSGAVALKIDMPVHADRWYRALCSRQGDTVTLHLTEYEPDGSTRKWASTAMGATGAVTSDDGKTPLSVGGKLTGDGNIAPSNDQFNGEVDDVLLRIHR